LKRISSEQPQKNQQLLKMDEYVKKPKVIKEEKCRWESPNLQFELDKGGKTSVAEIKANYNKKGEVVNWENEMNKMTPTSQVEAYNLKNQVLSAKGIFIEEFFDEN